MLGRTIDYWMLRPFVRSESPEAEGASSDGRNLNIQSARDRFEKWNQRLNNEIAVDPAMHYLDVGCGTGEISLALAERGCGHVTGIDKDSYYIEVARRHARKMQFQDKVTFECMDVYDLPDERKYDVVLSHEMLEHVARPRDFLYCIDAVLKSRGGLEGTIILAFGPLFHSPLGGHLNAFFRFRIPWIGVLFSEGALMRLRREFWRPEEGEVKSFADMRGGLNKMKLSEFLRYVEELGWRTEQLIVNPQLKRWPVLYRISNLLMHVPLLRDYFAVSVYAIYRRPWMIGEDVRL